MNAYTLTSYKGQLSKEENQLISEGLLAHHKQNGHERISEIFSVLLKKDKDVLGGIKVTFLWNGMEINSLWIADGVRGQGWGKKLLGCAEAEAIRRGCAISYVNTFSWQSPEFYKKMGYVSYGVLDDFPKGASLYYFRKNLL